ncbi:MAG TPA: M4 family metallopeptidase [Dyadobacter sp.]|jgi:Zn-dependent metalloprotease|nr:M4 family metallopeptidase [Dyadobacter sp.]
MRYTLQLILILLLISGQSIAQDALQNEISTFASKTGAVPTISKATQSLGFMRFPATRAMKVSNGKNPADKAMTFMKENGGLFKSKWENEAFTIKESKKDKHGQEHVTLQQHINGVPVFDGVLKFHFNQGSDLTSLNGNFIGVSKLNTLPSIKSTEAEQLAIKHVTGQKLGNIGEALHSNKTTLYVFQKGLAQGYRGAVHLVYEVEVANGADIREFVYIDAHTKEVVEQFAGMHSIDRKLYETSISAANLKWKESDGLDGATFAALDQWQKSEVKSAGHIYNLMKNTFGFVSYNNADASMITINNNPDVNCPNATWNGRAASFCTGTATDDIVAHEWAHAYTENTSGLIYAWQTGAMNESYSDIWGETVDMLNNYMDEDESNALRTGCASSSRWKIGEKASAFNYGLRDMWDPTCYNNPGKVSDPQYWCASTDNGGVHINSGILNHAFALLVDGGTYNGQTITGLGLTKAAHIFWRAQSEYMTSTTDFAAQADILEASLADLIGVNLQALSLGEAPAGSSGEIITEADAAQLSKVLAAVELRGSNACGFQVMLKPVSTLCSGASPGNAIYFENFESGLGEWAVSATGSNPAQWVERQWLIRSGLPGAREGKAAYAVDFSGGDCINNFQNGVMSLRSPVITIPANTVGPITAAFDHYVATEANYDGGNVKYRINNGDWLLVPAAAFTDNPYNITLAQTGDNPLRGQPGFSGANQGSVGGSWGQSRINLSTLNLTSGQTIQLRWDFGTDGCGGLDGWYIDDFRIYNCSAPSVQFVTTATTVNEGEATIASAYPNECLEYVEKTVTIKINGVPSQPVTVTLQTQGTAKLGETADFSFSPASFVLQAGHLSQDIKVRIYDDAYIEDNESLVLTYTLTSPEGGNAFPETFGQSHTFTIIDNDRIPTSVNNVLISEDFEKGMPEGWNVVGGGLYPATWAVVNLGTVWLDPLKPKLLFINSDAAGNVNMDKVVESAPFNTAGMSNIQLSFQEYFYVWASGFAEQAMVDVWDGNAWRTILKQTQQTGTSGSWVAPVKRTLQIPAEYGNAGMKLRFRYIANYDYWWAIDNVKLSADSPKKVQTAVMVTPDVQYLGAGETAQFFDPATGNLVARINNFGDHNYGCTAVAVDRAGTDAVSWMDSFKMTNKTFKVTPRYNNPAGSYEITLFYGAAELPNFNGAQIRSMSKSSDGIASAVPEAMAYAEVSSAHVFNTDHAFTSVFHTGFSGFALSDKDFKETSLPVTLSHFSGANTVEGNRLTWETTSELKNDRFEIERSQDGRFFEKIGTVAGTGNSAITQTYRFFDQHFKSGANYYRLRQVDTDGSFAYSKIISIDNQLQSAVVKHFPNPVQYVLHIDVTDAETKDWNVKLVSMAGRVVVNHANVKAVNGRITENLEKLGTGVYQVIISNEKTSHTFSVFKL